MSYEVALRFGARRFVRLRELRGDDAEYVGTSDTSTETALELLDRLLATTSSPEAERIAAVDLTVSDRDRVLAALYVNTYGPRVSSTVRCTRCEARFDLDFELNGLLDSLESESHGPATDIIQLSDGRRFRVPTGRDERTARARDVPDTAAALLALCALDGVRPEDASEVGPALRRAAPLISTDVTAHCPECGLEQSFRFDLQGYLLAAIAAEARGLVEEVHRIAWVYGWSRAEILALPRSQRRAHVALIDSATSSRRRVRS